MSREPIYTACLYASCEMFLPSKTVLLGQILRATKKTHSSKDMEEYLISLSTLVLHTFYLHVL